MRQPRIVGVRVRTSAGFPDNPSMTTTATPPACPAPPEPGALYQHWKGGLYRVVALAVEEATGAPTVVYRPLSDPAERCWTRPLVSFEEEVEGLDGEARARFVHVPLPGDGALRDAARRTGIPDDLVDATLARYREPHRRYHAEWHAADVFARAAGHGLELDLAQSLALLFHDAVYVAGAEPRTNEALSALLLRQAAHGRESLPREAVERACAIVMDTAGHVPTAAGAREAIALDLATLADPPHRFDTWTELVWLEYRHLFAGQDVPRDAFMRRRLAVLGSLLASCRDLDVLPDFGERFAANVERLARRLSAPADSASDRRSGAAGCDRCDGKARPDP
jgi:predicted metal-dependent HD superfamily phosphohydrolase